MYKELLQQIIKDHPFTYSTIIKFHHKTIRDELTAMYPSNTFSESLYRYLHDIDKLPSCTSCNNSIKFGSLNTGYPGVYCSYNCRDSGRKHIAREIRNCKLCSKSFEVHKVTKRSYCSQECRVVIGQQNAKTRTANSAAANRRNHGGVYATATEEFKNKAKATKLLRYGDENFSNPAKAKMTKLEKYGNSNYTNLEKGHATKLLRYGDMYYNNRSKFLDTIYIKSGYINYEDYLRNKSKRPDKTSNKAIHNCLYCNMEYNSHTQSEIRCCSRKCAYLLRKVLSREYRICAECNNEFLVYKNNRKKCCSQNCAGIHIPYHENRINSRNLIIKERYGVDNIMKLQEYRDKIANTKLLRYGNSSYNNINKNIETCLARYGVKYVFLCTIKSNGKSISKSQKQLFDIVQNIYQDAVIEHQLVDIGISVDIFIPSKNLIIEFYGDFWHCNPNKYNSEDYNRCLHKTAKEKWELDIIRENKIKEAGYNLKIVWESDFKKNDFNINTIFAQ